MLNNKWEIPNKRKEIAAKPRSFSNDAVQNPIKNPMRQIKMGTFFMTGTSFDRFVKRKLHSISSQIGGNENSNDM